MLLEIGGPTVNTQAEESQDHSSRTIATSRWTWIPPSTSYSLHAFFTMVDRTRNQVAAVDREKVCVDHDLHTLLDVFFSVRHSIELTLDFFYQTCPFLLRVFVKPGAHHEIDRDFQVPDRLPLPDESQLYAWWVLSLY